MIDLAGFFTIKNNTLPQGGEGNGGLTSQLAALKLISGEGKDEDGKIGGGGIFDVLLNQLEERIANNEEASELLTAKTSEKNGELRLLSILAGNEKIAENVERLDEIADLDLISKVEQTLAMNQRLFENAMRAGTGNDDLTIDKETGEIVVPDIGKSLNLFNESNKLSNKSINELINNLDLNTLNLSPGQVSLVQDIQNGIVPTEAQAKDVQSIINTILAGAVAIVPPPVRSDIIIPPQALKAAGKPASLELAKSNVAANDASGSLNALSRDASGTPLPFATDDAVLDGVNEFEAMLKDVAAGKKGIGNGITDDDAALNANLAAKNTPPQGVFNVLQAWPLAASGSLYGPSSYSDPAAEQLGLSLTNAQSQGSLSALVGQAQSAAHPHPATQMVAASITKGGKGGVDTNISLRLDPPGLGRVEVNMTFSKDKTMKAIVTAEKPETYMMLQRDAQVLERALQDAGLDADSGLSFELAEHGLDFDQHNQRGGGHDNGKTAGVNGDADGELEIIESTMTWSVDPESGHTRYDIWA